MEKIALSIKKRMKLIKYLLNSATVIVMDINTKQYMTKQICDIRAGDMVKCVNEQFANVILVIELARDKKRMIELSGGLCITGGHPIQRNGLWCLPREQNDGKFCDECDSVFMFVLDKIHVRL